MLEKMKRYVTRKTIVLVIVGIMINLVGGAIASHLKLPLWLDSIGTGVSACLIGPIGGAVCGGISNLLRGILHPTNYIYCITGISIGVVIGIGYKKDYFKNFSRMMVVGGMVAFVATMFSTPLNLMFYKGCSQNVWGDALYDMLKSQEWNTMIASMLGQLFVEFPDKLITVVLTYVIIRIPSSQHKKRNQDKKVPTVVGILLFFTLIVSQMPNNIIMAHTNQILLNSDNETMTSQDSLFYTQTIYNSENGLTAGEANAIVQTEDGYVWIGTYAGLYRYDGRSFTLMNFESVKNVNRLFVDAKGRLWIGTNDKGISIYEDGNITQIIDQKNGLPSNSVRCIGQDASGNYYVGTSSTLCIISEEEQELKVVKEIPEVVYANRMSMDSNGRVAIITNAGILVLMENQDIIGQYQSTIYGNDFTSCVFSSRGELYIATSSNTLYTWDFEQQALNINSLIFLDTLNYTHSLYEAEEGVIWVCSDDGIGYVSNHRFVKVNTGIFTSSIDTMLKDYQGNLWFTSSRLGVLKLSANSFNDWYTQCKMNACVVNSTVFWNDRMYSGTDTGLQMIDIDSKAHIENDLTKLLRDNRIRCLFVDSKNHLWISTTGGIGLVEVSPDQKTTIYGIKEGTIGERFRSTIELSDGTIVAAENTGIDFIKDGNVIATLGEKDGLTNPQILTMVEKDSNTLLAGSDGNGIMVIENYKVVDRITEENGLPSGVILRMVKVDDGFVIVTSNSLCYLNNNNQVTELKEFPYSNNYDVITSAEGKLWVLGSAGIYIVDKESLLQGGPIQYELLDSRKGLKTSLTANSWNCVKDNVLYFAGNSGVYSIDMSNYHVYTGEYRMMVDCLDSEDHSFALNENEVNIITHDTGRIKIRPELLNYTLNDPYISYYLEGVDEKEYLVQQSSLSDIAYTNLPTGEYVFHMSILDNTGSEVIQSRSYRMNKQPKFWEHEWFYLYLSFVCAMGVAYISCLFSVLRSNKIIEKQKHEIEEAKRQAELGNETILAIAKTVDAKDVNTSEHSERVSMYSVMIARKLGWTEEQCENLRKIALLHDLGKIGIPDSILKKPFRLDDNEYAIMKSHVVIGAKILKDFTLVENVQDGVRYHHEKYDGTGYVEGLRGEQIPKDARIIGIADAFDAMTSNRVYRKRMDMDYVIGELKKGRGTQFDPQLVDIMLEFIEDGSIQVKGERKSEEKFES